MNDQVTYDIISIECARRSKWLRCDGRRSETGTAEYQSERCFGIESFNVRERDHTKESKLIRGNCRLGEDIT